MSVLRALLCCSIAFLVLFSLAQKPSSQSDEPKPEYVYSVATRILHSPALSPDGKHLAFTYDGDIWTVPSDGGDARRLTITVDNDGSPCFSPDGKWLAFRSRRYGSDDVFIMPAQGGEAKRLTFADSADDPCCWLPDGSGVVFAATGRDAGRDLWVVRTDASEPWPITGGGMSEGESRASISPDGKRIVYVRHGGEPMRRRGYLGTASSDVWLCEFDGITTKNHKPLAATRSHDDWPCFADNDTIIYVTYSSAKTKSSRIGRLTAVNLAGEEIKGWGGETELDPRDVNVAGGKIAFATGNYGGWRLHVGDLGKRAPSKISTPEIRINSDVRTGEVKSTRLTSISEYQISPDGKKIAFIAGGDVFLLPTEEGGVPRQVTDTVEREKDLDWDSESKKLLYSSRRGGAWRVYGIDALTGAELFVQARGAQNSRGRFMPRSQRVAYVYDERSIIIQDKDSSQQFKGYFHGANIGGGHLFDISPDGQWLLYEQPNEIYDDALVVSNVASGEKYSLTRMFGSCGHASFSRDGKRITFVCDQEGNNDVYVIDLQKPPVEFKEDKLDKAFKDPKAGSGAGSASDEPKREEPKSEEPKKDEPKKDEPKKPEPKKPPETKIDFDRLDLRTRRVTSLEGDELWPVCMDDGKTFYFLAAVQGQSNLWKLTLDPDKGPDLKQITQSKSQKASLRLSHDEKSLWYTDGGTLTNYALQGGKTTTYPINIEQRRDRRVLRNETFKEACWVMCDYYYDEKHHGCNLGALEKRYAQALDATSTGDEFGVLFNELLGELNSSHQGFTAQDERSDGFAESTGCLGLRFDPVALSRGEYRIVEILKNGPLDIKDGPLPGIRIVGVNGKPLKGTTLAQALVNTTGKRVVLNLNDKLIMEGSRELAVKPISRMWEMQLFYERWVDAQRAMVHKLSDGRLGYVHIEGMDEPSLRHFKHHLGDDALGKDGMVIDVRYNGGGYTAVDVLEILIKRPWLIRKNRSYKEVSENAYRSVTLEKPSVLLINQDSFSNAEILAEGFRRLNIGKIVGVDTAGGVIGTGGFRLIDGSTMRLPGTGAYGIDGDNLELSGRKPDIFVVNHPEELDQGIDRQTEAAVTALLEQIAKSRNK